MPWVFISLFTLPIQKQSFSNTSITWIVIEHHSNIKFNTNDNKINAYLEMGDKEVIGESRDQWARTIPCSFWCLCDNYTLPIFNKCFFFTLCCSSWLSLHLDNLVIFLYHVHFDARVIPTHHPCLVGVFLLCLVVIANCLFRLDNLAIFLIAIYVHVGKTNGCTKIIPSISKVFSTPNWIKGVAPQSWVNFGLLKLLTTCPNTLWLLPNL